MNIIKLTHPDFGSIYFNADHIVVFYPNGLGTSLECLNCVDVWVVKETPDDIRNLIQEGDTND